MKVALMILMGCVLLIYESFSQSPPQADVTTPKGSPVTAYITPENPDNELRAYYDAYFATSSRTYLYYFGGSISSTRRFNCHGYAWNMVEGGPVRWIGYYQYNTDEHIYWEDGSYIEVCSEMYPGKVSWASGDHSAITTSTSGRWISKWNEFPLIEHNWNDTPYGTSNLKYYASTSISGPISALCSGTRTLSVANITGATYTWSVNTSALSIVSGQGTHQLTVQRNGNLSTQGWVEVEISTPCSPQTATSKKHTFWVGYAQIQEIQYPSPVVSPGDQVPLTILMQPDGHYGFDGFKVEIRHPDGSWTTIYSSNPTLSFPTPGMYMVRVYANNACGWSTNFYPLSFWCEEGGMMFSVYPNPAGETLTVSIGSETDGAQAMDRSTLPAFRAVLYDSQGRQQRQGGSKDGGLQFDTRSLPEGTYFLHIQHGKEVEKRQVVIRH